MKLHHPPVDTQWRITHSRLARYPEIIAADDLPELRSRVAEIIGEGNQFREDKKKIKDLRFRYEADEEDYVNVAHVLFQGYTGRTIRAMRLERI